jgi:chemotaxis methyl-accepting protein methylase
MDKYVAKRDPTLIKEVEFIKDDINYSKAPKNVKLILMRNVMIYFNPTYQEKILTKMYETITGAGTLIIGLKETITKNQSTSGNFEPIERNEGVYKKRM